MPPIFAYYLGVLVHWYSSEEHFCFAPVTAGEIMCGFGSYHFYLMLLLVFKVGNLVWSRMDSVCGFFFWHRCDSESTNLCFLQIDEGTSFGLVLYVSCCWASGVVETGCTGIICGICTNSILSMYRTWHQLQLLLPWSVIREVQSYLGDQCQRSMWIFTSRRSWRLNGPVI